MKTGSSRIERALAVSVFTLCVLGLVGQIGLGLTAAGPVPPLELLFAFSLPLMVLSFAIVGLVLVFKLRRNALGWLFLVVSASMSTIAIAEEYAPRNLPGADLVVWLYSWAFAPMLTSLVIFLPLLFPTGRLLSRRWRPVLWGGFLTLAFMIVMNAFGNPEPIEGIANPYAVPRLDWLWRILQIALVPLGLFSIVGAISSLIVRYRRSKGIERQQMKLFVFASVIAPIPFITYEINESLSEVILPLLVPLFPVAVAFAILRHRLYDVDIVINKALVYGSLTVLSIALYVGLVVGFQTLLRPLTPQSDLAIVASTLGVAAMFNPLRRRVQAFVDRRFYRKKYDSQRTLEAFGMRLRHQVDLTSLEGDLGAVVNETLQPASVLLWLGKSKEQRA